MNVRELRALLSQCNPEALVVAPLLFQGTEEITSVERLNLGGVGFRPSSEEVPVIRLGNGNVPHMRKQGMDVLGGGDSVPDKAAREPRLEHEFSGGDWSNDPAVCSHCGLSEYAEDSECPARLRAELELLRRQARSLPTTTFPDDTED